MNTAVLWIIVGLAGGYMLLRFLSGRLSGVTHVGARQAEELIDEHDAVVLDVRTQDEYAAGRIPNARHMPLSQMSTQIKELEKYRGRPIIVSCRSGSRSARACRLLKKNGFENVYNLRGGIRSWARANRAVVR